MDRAYKAKQLRHRRAALAMIQRDRVCDELYDIMNECTDVAWEIENDEEKLLDLYDGDWDEVSEFRLQFFDLANKCEKLDYQLRDGYVTEHFDDFFVGSLGDAYNMVGYDFYEEDYFSLTSFEASLAQGVSGKRLMRLTKEELISVAGQCIGIMMCFLDIRHGYDCLKAAFDFLRDDNAELLKNVRSLEDIMDRLHDDPHDPELNNAFDSIVSMLPDRVWVE